MLNLSLSQKIHSHLQQTQRILIVPHQNPDGDAIGSMSALAEYLLNYLKKEVDVFCATAIPPNLKFIPHSHLIKTDESLFSQSNLDAIIVVDSGDLRYAGIHKYIKNHPAKIINIDHHPTNEQFGHFNLVNHRASSAAEVVVDFFKANQIKLNKNMATALLTGILTDTDNFTNGATTMRALNIAGELLRSGTNIRQINRWTLKNNSINTLKLWGVVLNRLEYNPIKDMAYTYLTRIDYQKYELDEKEVDGISNFMNTIGGVKVGLFLKETTDGKIKGSFRTTRDDVDVSAMAKKLNGGGHKKAAGFTVIGSDIQTVLNQILTA